MRDNVLRELVWYGNDSQNTETHRVLLYVRQMIRYSEKASLVPDVYENKARKERNETK